MCAERCRFRSFRAAAFMAMFCRPTRRLDQSRERLDNLRAQIDSDVRTALLNLQSSAEQVEGGAQQH